MADKPKKRPRAHDFLMQALDEGKLRKPDWSPQVNLVLRDIAERINHKTKDAWPSIPSIARRTWISERQVSKIVGELKRAGILQVQERPYTSSRYAVVLPSAEYMALYGRAAVKADANGSEAADYADDADGLNQWNEPEAGLNEWEQGEEADTPFSRRDPPFSQRYPPFSQRYPPFSQRYPRSESVVTPQITSQGTSQENREHEPLPVLVCVQVSGVSTSWEGKYNDNSKDNDTASSELSLPVHLPPTAATPETPPPPPQKKWSNSQPAWQSCFRPRSCTAKT